MISTLGKLTIPTVIIPRHTRRFLPLYFMTTTYYDIPNQFPLNFTFDTPYTKLEVAQLETHAVLVL